MTTEILIENRTFSRRHVLFGVFCVALVLLCSQPLLRLIQLSLHLGNSDLSYIPLIPFISAVLIYWDRRSILSNAKTTPVRAAMLFALGGILCFLGRTFAVRLNENDYISLMTAAVISFFFGGVMLSYGSTIFKAALFPLLFLLLAIPLPTYILDVVVKFLQRGSAELTAMLFAVTGTLVYRDDMSFFLPRVTIVVAEECSGIRSTLGIVIMTLLAGRLLLKSNWHRLILLAAVVPTSLFKNAVRIVTLTLLAVHVDMGFLKGRLHEEGGIVFMMIGLAMLYPLLTFLVRSERKELLSEDTVGGQLGTRNVRFRRWIASLKKYLEKRIGKM